MINIDSNDFAFGFLVGWFSMIFTFIFIRWVKKIWKEETK